MAINWVSVLKMVPWSEVISNAPKIAEGAKSLWKTVAKKPAETPEATIAETIELEPIDILKAQVASTEVAVSELHTQMLESSQLIKALAEQNTELVRRVELNRIRVIWLGSAMFVLTIVTMVIMVMFIIK